MENNKRLEPDQVIDVLFKATTGKVTWREFIPAIEDAAYYIEKYKVKSNLLKNNYTGETFICEKCKTQRSKCNYCPDCGRKMIRLKGKGNE